MSSSEGRRSCGAPVRLLAASRWRSRRRLRLSPARRRHYAFTSVYVNAAGRLADRRRAEAHARRRRNRRSRKPRTRRQVTLDLSRVADDKEVLSLSGGGRVREYALSKRVTVRPARRRGSRLDARRGDRRPPLVLVQRVRSAGARGAGGEAAEGDADRRRATDRPAAAGGEEAGEGEATDPLHSAAVSNGG